MKQETRTGSCKGEVVDVEEGEISDVELDAEIGGGDSGGIYFSDDIGDTITIFARHRASTSEGPATGNYIGILKIDIT